jgi:hypothetical protein
MGVALAAHSFVLALQDTRYTAHGGEAGSALALLALVPVAGLLWWVDRYRGRRRPRRPADREWRARALMSELCPHGWTAEIAVYGWGAPPPEDAPPSPVPLVSLTWSEYEDDGAGGARKVVARRLWARSVADALEAMIADRRLDLELEQIEHQADRDM